MEAGRAGCAGLRPADNGETKGSRMDVYEAIANRFSARAYQPRPVEDDKLRRVLEAGVNSPSARNRQSRRFVVVRDEKVRAALVKASGQEWLAGAPVILAVVGLTPSDTMHCGVPTDPVDCAIAIDHMTLAAVAEGLGTCWVGHFQQAACREAIKAPPTVTVIELLALGYPAAHQPPRKREPMDKVVSFDKFA
jgi:nitroreductase